MQLADDEDDMSEETLKRYIAQSFIDGEDNPGVLIDWNYQAVALFAEKENTVLTERPYWLTQWPVTSKSLMRNIVDYLNGAGEPCQIQSFGLRLISPPNCVRLRLVTAKQAIIESHPYMQEVMRAVRKESPSVYLAKISDINDKSSIIVRHPFGKLDLSQGLENLFE